MKRLMRSAYTDANAAASVGVYQPVVMPPTMMTGVSRAGKDCRKSPQTLRNPARLYFGKFLFLPITLTMSIIVRPMRIPGIMPPMKSAATDAFVSPE